MQTEVFDLDLSYTSDMLRNGTEEERIAWCQGLSDEATESLFKYIPWKEDPEIVSSVLLHYEKILKGTNIFKGVTVEKIADAKDYGIILHVSDQNHPSVINTKKELEDLGLQVLIRE